MGGCRFLPCCWLGLALLTANTIDSHVGAARGQGGGSTQPPMGVNRDLPDLDEERLNRERQQPVETKPIYNDDDRMDLGTVWDPKLKKIAGATVALFNPSALVPSADGSSYTVNAPTLAKAKGLCPKQRFEGQIAGAYCSGVLIAPDIVLTAGHCVNEIKKAAEPEARQIHFVFGFSAKNDKDPGVTSFSASRVFKGKELIGGKLVPKADGGEDWATVKLEKPVPPELAQPVEAISKRKIANGASVYVMGHPDGLPLKYAAGAKVTVNDANNYFVANLDTFGGNSGSGVFLKDSNTLVGILVRGFTDYYRTSEGCSKAYPCPSTSCSGEDVTRIEIVPLR